MSEWQDVDENIPEDTEILVSVTYNLDDRTYETKTWVDEWCSVTGWRVYGERIDIPFPPKQWMPLPAPPVFEE